mmetsp:Transcript_32983/g.84540  ORF Transcript_32983/g.84540 Transcript_32983/m.84540 type:complete len:433 (-) Transcript_32983:80-1378(-)
MHHARDVLPLDRGLGPGPLERLQHRRRGLHHAVVLVEDKRLGKARATEPLAVAHIPRLPSGGLPRPRPRPRGGPGARAVGLDLLDLRDGGGQNLVDSGLVRQPFDERLKRVHLAHALGAAGALPREVLGDVAPLPLAELAAVSLERAALGLDRGGLGRGRHLGYRHERSPAGLTHGVGGGEQELLAVGQVEGLHRILCDAHGRCLGLGRRHLHLDVAGGRHKGGQGGGLVASKRLGGGGLRRRRRLDGGGGDELGLVIRERRGQVLEEGVGRDALEERRLKGRLLGPLLGPILLQGSGRLAIDRVGALRGRGGGVVLAAGCRGAPKVKGLSKRFRRVQGVPPPGTRQVGVLCGLRLGDAPDGAHGRRPRLVNAAAHASRIPPTGSNRPPIQPPVTAGSFPPLPVCSLPAYFPPPSPEATAARCTPLERVRRL